MFMAIILLAFLPWLDTSKVKSANFRPVYKIFFWLFVLDAVLLGFIGSQPPEGGYVLAGQLLTTYYFLHLLVITPLLGLFETPLPLPASIAEAVLGRGGAGSAAAMSAHAAASPNTKG
jgi:quinol-cytochrome oxidoreductase complex cytochrome b subunit